MATACRSLHYCSSPGHFLFRPTFFFEPHPSERKKEKISVEKEEGRECQSPTVRSLVRRRPSYSHPSPAPPPLAECPRFLLVSLARISHTLHLSPKRTSSSSRPLSPPSPPTICLPTIHPTSHHILSKPVVCPSCPFRSPFFQGPGLHRGLFSCRRGVCSLGLPRHRSVDLERRRQIRYNRYTVDKVYSLDK
jgi:hypothetical protein